MERVFVDTSAWVALANREDASHAAVRQAIQSWDGRLVTTNLVVAETVTVALYRFGHGAATRLGMSLWGGAVADVVRVEVQDERSAWGLFVERPDKEYSLADCASFVVMRRLKLRKAIGLDEHFTQEKFELLPVARRSRR